MGTWFLKDGLVVPGRHNTAFSSRKVGKLKKTKLEAMHPKTKNYSELPARELTILDQLT